jgi:pimeloyl-ACP methyl ester carboxylesterase
VLVLPRLGALRSEHRCLAPMLHDAGYRTVTVDLRGHGESSAPWEAYDVPSVGGDMVKLFDTLYPPCFASATSALRCAPNRAIQALR